MSWNLCYEDVALATQLVEFFEVVVADDFSAWRHFEVGTPLDEIMGECKSAKHLCTDGAQQILFD